MKTKSIQKIALYLLLLLLGMVPFQLQAQITVKITQRDPTIIIPLDAKVFLKVLWNMEEGKIFFYKDKELENLNITCNSQSVGVGLGKTEAKFPVEKNKKSGNYNIIYDGGTQKTINIVFDWSKAEPQAKTPASAGTTATPVPPVEKKIDPVEELVQKIRTQNFKSRANEFEDESFQYIQPDKVIESSPEEIRRMLKTGNALYSNLNLYLVKIQDTKGSAADRKRLRPDSLELARYAGKVNSINVQLAVKSISKQKSDLIFKKFETTFLPQYNLDACTRQIERAERALDKPDLIRWLNLLIGGYKGDLNSGIKELDKKLSGLDHTFGLFSNTESRSFGVSEEIISALLSMQKENVVASIKKKQKEMQEMAEKISSVRPPYGSFALIAVTLFIVIYGGYFYARAYKKRQIKAKEEQKRREERAKNQGGIKVRSTVSARTAVGINLQADAQNYYVINVHETFADTAVEKIYFKKECIEELYRFFSDTLKDVQKPKEAGCYLLGRWDAKQDANKTFYSLTYETMVKPGDDAVYEEYELNFGAKIGVKMGTRLAELREKTKNQYVHTSWVHSHPGLGIFLSNHDLIVQNQLNSPDHICRLTAMVIDILTPNMNFIIFTAKQSGVMNNKEDAKKEMSLEDLVKWAKNPGERHVNLNEYRNILPETLRMDSPAKKILLNKKSIIEIEEKAKEVKEDIAAYFAGFSTKIDEVSSTVAINNVVLPGEIHQYAAADIKGCLLVCERYETNLLEKLKKSVIKPLFVVVYESATEQVMCIPLLMNETYSSRLYPEPYFEWLKWTRRRQ